MKKIIVLVLTAFFIFSCTINPVSEVKTGDNSQIESLIIACEGQIKQEVTAVYQQVIEENENLNVTLNTNDNGILLNGKQENLLKITALGSALNEKMEDSKGLFSKKWYYSKHEIFGLRESNQGILSGYYFIERHRTRTKTGAKLGAAGRTLAIRVKFGKCKNHGIKSGKGPSVGWYVPKDGKIVKCSTPSKDEVEQNSGGYTFPRKILPPVNTPRPFPPPVVRP